MLDLCRNTLRIALARILELERELRKGRSAMADDYELLTEAEQAHWDEYTRLREISDHAGFDDHQKRRKEDARSWLDARRAYIHDLAEGEIEGEKPGWDVSNRRERYAMLAPERLNGGDCRRQASLPKGEATDNEAVYIREREMWWQVTSTTDAQKQRKIACTSWLEERRKYVWRQAEGEIDSDAGPGWDKKHRERRYDNLCVATKYGSAYADWQKGHNDYTGEPVDDGDGGGGGGGDSSTRHRLSEHFVIEEFDCHDGTQCGSREHNGLEYLCKTFLEPLRDKYGSVHINSGFRTRSYNASVGGASGSFHIYTDHDGDDQAADISCDRGTPSQWHSTLNWIRQNKRNGNGGLGLYSTFVHVDLRDYPSDWRG